VNPESLFDQASLGVIDLQKLFEDFSNFEPMLYAASEERYRDHVAHPFRVWMLGHLVLDDCLSWQLRTEGGTSVSIDATEWKCMWAIAALCHDLGYPLAEFTKVNKKARESLASLGTVPLGDLRFEFSRQTLPFHDTMIKLMASKPVKVRGRTGYFTHIQNKYYLKYLKSFDKLDHGIVSALLVSKSLVHFLESDFCHDTLIALEKKDAKQFLIRRDILRAIASHTCLDIYHLGFNTLPFVLYLVDEMQGWGRPTWGEIMESNERSEEQETILYEFGSEKVSLRFVVPESAWAVGAKKGGWIPSKLNNLHRIMRLAVGTPGAKNLELEVRCGRITSNGETNQQAAFHLKGGRITKEPEGWFAD
jgi:hypothetical protein